MALAATAGLLAGVVTSFAQTVLSDPVAGLANAVTPWLVAPFLVGALGAARRWGAVLGVLACALQVVGYYATAAARGFGVNPGTVGFWLVCALVGGAVAGAAGWSWWRSGEPAAATGSTATVAGAVHGRERGLGAALLVAAWLAEALVSYGYVLGYVDDAVTFAVVGLLAAVLLTRRGPQARAVLRWLAPALAAGCVGFAALHALGGAA